MSVDIYAMGDLYPQSPPYPASPLGSSWFLRGWNASATVTFDVGNGLAPIVMSNDFFSSQTFMVDLAIDMTQVGTFYPTIRAFGYLENRYRDGDATGFFSERSPFDVTWTMSSITIAPVPSPIVGAGIPGLLMAIAGFIGWRHSRRAITT